MNLSKEFYEARVAECEAQAAGSVLDNVRDRSLRAAAAWQLMADGLAERETAAKAERDDRDAALAH